MERDRLLSGDASWEGKTWDEGKWTETRKVGGIERKKIKDNIQAELKKDISTWGVAFPYTLKVHICKLADTDTNSYILPPCTTITYIHNFLIFLITYKSCVHEHINILPQNTHTPLTLHISSHPKEYRQHFSKAVWNKCRNEAHKYVKDRHRDRNRKT